MIIKKVDKYGVDSLKFPVLKEKELKDLLYRMQHGDYECREIFIKENSKLILSVIQRFNNRGESAEDLFQVGRIGLIKSIDKFDLSLNSSFLTYAVPVIIGEIRRYLRDNNSIRVSRSLKDIAYRALQVRDRLVNQDNKEPTISQISKELGLPGEDIIHALDALKDPVSLFEPIYHDGGDAINIVDKISDTKKLNDRWLENRSIKDAIKNLNSREELILNLRFSQGRTQMEVAEEVGISKAQVSRLEKTALKNMRKYV